MDDAAKNRLNLLLEQCHPSRLPMLQSMVDARKAADFNNTPHVIYREPPAGVTTRSWTVPDTNIHLRFHENNHPQNPEYATANNPAYDVPFEWHVYFDNHDPNQPAPFVEVEGPCEGEWHPIKLHLFLPSMHIRLNSKYIIRLPPDPTHYGDYLTTRKEVSPALVLIVY